MSTSKRKAAPKRARAAIRKKEDEYHHGDLRRALIVAGGDMLEADGADALSLREVARRAGVSHNAPYRHFPDRAALLAAIAADGFSRLAEAIGAAEGERLEIGVAYVRFAVDHPRLFDLMFGPMLSPRDYPDLAHAMTATFTAFAGSFDGSSEDGDGARLIAPWALVHGLAHLLLSKRMASALTGGRDVEALTRAVLRANAGKT